jgi:hypothetical protein
VPPDVGILDGRFAAGRRLLGRRPESKVAKRDLKAAVHEKLSVIAVNEGTPYPLV